MHARQFIKLTSFLALFSIPLIVLGGSQTLDQVRERDSLRCGVNQGLPGFSNPDDEGRWTGIDVDMCRAIAAATLGDADKVEYVPLSAKERFTALTSKEIDVLSRNTTWTFSRDTGLGLDFTVVNYYDGQGFMVPRALGIQHLSDLLVEPGQTGPTICTNEGTTTELNLADYFRAHQAPYQPITFEKADEVVEAYDSGRCDVYTTDRSGLAAQRIKLDNPDDHIILEETISKEPLGPVVRQGDDTWADIVTWSFYVMLNAEELGINSQNVKHMRESSTSPAINRILGSDGAIGPQLDLNLDWAYQIILQVGNYAEVYERNLGSQTPLNLPRGLNALWNAGGIQYAPPVR